MGMKRKEDRSRRKEGERLGRCEGEKKTRNSASQYLLPNAFSFEL
jgi:hypothetical protein